MEVLQNLQKLRVGTRMLYPHQNPHPGIFKKVYPYPGYCATGEHKLTEVPARVVPGEKTRVCTMQHTTLTFTELTEVHRTGMEVLQNSDGSLPEPTEVPGRYTTVVKYPYPYPHSLFFKGHTRTYSGYCATGVHNVYRSDGYG